jgi:LacI family transcriptional regulator
MKRVLLVLNDYRREMHEAIVVQAHHLGWSLEASRHGIPFGWSGDGAIIDRCSPADILHLRQAAPVPIPIATITDLPGPRIGRVLGDARAIAELSLAFLERRGFTRFVGLDTGTWAVDPTAQFCALAKSRGYSVDHLIATQDGSETGFQRQAATVAGTLSAITAPIGLFLGGSHLCLLALNACRIAHKQIPDQIAILANDDDPLICESSRPGISAVKGESRRIGTLLCLTLARMFTDSADPGGKVLVSPDLVIDRASTNAVVVPHAPTMRAIRHMLANFPRISGIDEVAKVAGVSTPTLREKFMQYVQRQPKEYLIDIRMQEALHLLKTTDRTLEEIGSDIGYSSAMTFYAAFKRIYGKTPGEYRQEYRQPS